jgi:hypothetical protein
MNALKELNKYKYYEEVQQLYELSPHLTNNDEAIKEYIKALVQMDRLKDMKFKEVIITSISYIIIH